MTSFKLLVSCISLLVQWCYICSTNASISADNNININSHSSNSNSNSVSERKRVLYVGRSGSEYKDVQRLSNNDDDKLLPLPYSIHELGQLSRRVIANGNSNSYSNSGRRRLRLRQLGLTPELTPLYPGYGTHFAYVFVGTPGQRQSVIIDTGSHYTAFPCIGCEKCGQHTDNYWDIKNSSTATVPKCNNQPCQISQSYSEGSSWKAYKVVDKLWVGGITENFVPGASSYAVDFLFGCQSSETGLFRTQLADGIMGMSMAEDTLPTQLVKQKVTDSKVFALCFRIGGGIMTLGGVDQRIHSKPGIEYAKLLKTDGWFTVHLLDVFLQDQRSGKKQSLQEDPAKFNSGKGVIVDSGTTDTYLPASVAAKFGQIFKQLSGHDMTSNNIALSEEDLTKMPNIIFALEGTNGKPFEVTLPWTNYVDSVGEGKYAFRVYLTEGSGTVLGANFMTGYNTIFDEDNKRVGFGKSNCKFEDFSTGETDTPTPQPTTLNGIPDVPVKCEPEMIPFDQCSAKCSQSSGPYIATGVQKWVDKCDVELGTITEKPCSTPCVGNKVVRGNPYCPDKAWTDCEHGCIQSRMVVSYDITTANPNLDLTKAETCQKYTQQTRTCYAGGCALSIGDYLVFIDLRVQIQPSDWSYVYAEDFYSALAALFKIRENNIELLNNAGSEYTYGVKLHFQIRLKGSDFPDVTSITKAAQNIPAAVWRQDFKKKLIADLVLVSSNGPTRVDHSRYGWMTESDIEILNAMALPYGDVRDPIEIPNDGGPVEIVVSKVIADKADLLLLGSAIASFLMLLLVLCCHIKLRSDFAALSKDKIANGSLMKMYQRLKNMGKDPMGKDYKYSALEMTELNEADGSAVEQGVVSAADDDDNDDDNIDMNTFGRPLGVKTPALEPEREQ